MAHREGPRTSARKVFHFIISQKALRTSRHCVKRATGWTKMQGKPSQNISTDPLAVCTVQYLQTMAYNFIKSLASTIKLFWKFTQHCNEKTKGQDQNNSRFEPMNISCSDFFNRDIFSVMTIWVDLVQLPFKNQSCHELP